MPDAAGMKIAGISSDDIVTMAREVGLSGVVSLAPLGGGASLDLAFGFADRANRVPNNPETRFAMASGCKSFTALAIGRLIEEGKVTLDTTLADCVRSRGFHFGHQVTVGQLLNHTSGVPDYFDEEVHDDFAALWKERPCYDMSTIQSFLPMFEAGPMKAEPGSAFHYCNAGFILAGLVVEELAQRDFRDFVAERILKPCGMTRSGYFAMNALPNNTALGYLSDAESDLTTNVYAVPIIGGPDGGAFTTVADLRAFWSALLAGRVLSRGTLDTFFAPSVAASERGEHWFYGRGFWLRKVAEQWVVSIEGLDPGVSMESEVRRDEGVIVTVLSNTSEGAGAMIGLLDDRIDAALR